MISRLTTGQQVAIIGAGIGGLVTAKVLSEAGFEVTIFEKEPTLGGVWNESRTYPGLRANNSKETYCFSDFAYPDSVKDFPNAEEVRNFLTSYADHFNIRNKINFACEVTNLSAKDSDSQQGFDVTICRHGAESTEVLYFPFVVICNGVYSTISLPEIDGMDAFAGRILHSSQAMENEVADAKNVITVGAGKSALDCAASAALNDKTSTLVFRKAHWMAPRYLPGGGRSDLRMVSRFTELFFEYPNQTPFERFLHGPGKFIVNAWWALQNAVLPKAAKMAPIMIPQHRMPTGFESIGQIDHFYDLLNEGRITAKRSNIKKFTPTGVELDNGETLDADLVVFATGWQRDLSFMDERLRNEIFSSGTFRLFRRILPPEHQRLAFIGYFPTLSCSISSEIAAQWTAQCFSGAMTLPSVDEMDDEIDRLEDWARKRLPGSTDGIFTGPYHSHYVNDLMNDMGMPVHRTSNFLTEYLGTFIPQRFAGLGRELEEKRNNRNRPHRGFYLSGMYSAVGLLGIFLAWVILT